MKAGRLSTLNVTSVVERRCSSLVAAGRELFPRLPHAVVHGGQYGNTRPPGSESPPTDDASDRRDPSDALLPLTPQGRILALLETNGGEMKQSQIVAENDWSKSTVSRNLGELESVGAVRRYQIGREKQVFLPGTEPDVFETPFAGESEAPISSA